MNCRRSWN